MRALIAGNWKMNGLAVDAAALAEAVAQAEPIEADLVVCPPATVLALVARRLAGTAVTVGGQDCHAEEAGAHTGDVSAAMLRDAGAAWVILGHSERRAEHHETDDLVRRKVAAAVAQGLTPIVCVGESAAQRAEGRHNEVVAGQLAGSLPRDFTGVVAYEPIWAIGTGRTPTEAEVADMHGFIRAELRRDLGADGETVRILYGGSVKPGNAGSLLALPEVGGALVGGASLVAADFLGIARASVLLSKGGAGR